MQQIITPPKFFGEPGKRYTPISGMIRTVFTEPTKWGMKVDSQHSPCGIKSVKALSSGKVDIQFEDWVNAKKIVSLCVTPHQSAIQAGFVAVGAEVGLTSAKAQLMRYVQSAGRITWSGSAFAIDKNDDVARVCTVTPGPWTIVAGVNDKISITMNGGSAQVFTLTPGVGRTAAQIVTDLAGLTGGAATNTVTLVYITSTTMGYSSKITINTIANSCYDTLGLTPDTDANALEFTVTSVANSSGNIVVTHGYSGNAEFSMSNIPHVSPYAGGYIPHITTWSTTTTTIGFWDYAGVQVTTPDANCKCFFSRQGMTSPHAYADYIPDGLTFWVNGLMEI